MTRGWPAAAPEQLETWAARAARMRRERRAQEAKEPPLPPVEQAGEPAQAVGEQAPANRHGSAAPRWAPAPPPANRCRRGIRLQQERKSASELRARARQASRAVLAPQAEPAARAGAQGRPPPAEAQARVRAGARGRPPSAEPPGRVSESWVVRA